MLRSARVVALVLMAGLVMASLAAPAGAAPPRRTRPAGPATSLVGQIAPAVQATRVSGTDPVSLDGLRGRVVIVDFWATWCGPCVATMPMLDAMHRRHHGGGLTVIGLTEESRATVQQHLRQQPVQYTVAQDVGRTATRYGVSAIPTLVVIDRAGKVRDVIVGVPEPQRLAQVIQGLLSERVP
jgi:thiol-disulfide isomerase/thioredoxin